MSALHAATALEQLAKAYLASIHGALVAAADFDSLLHACGESRHAKKPQALMRTITVRDAIDRAGQLIGPLANLKGSLGGLIDVRNGVVHAAYLDVDDVGVMLRPFLRACDHLLTAMDVDRDDFFGEFVGVADAQIKESTEDAERRVAEALASARLAFKERWLSLDEPARTSALASVEATYSPIKYEEDIVTCPACREPALVGGTYEVDWEADWDVEGSRGPAYIAGVYPVVKFSPGYLGCRVCGLELDGEEELAAAGIAESWMLDDVDPRDFANDDRDWDDYRDYHYRD
jgi:hypothetical protein